LLTVTAVALLFGMRRLGSSLAAGQGGG